MIQFSLKLQWNLSFLGSLLGIRLFDFPQCAFNVFSLLQKSTQHINFIQNKVVPPPTENAEQNCKIKNPNSLGHCQLIPYREFLRFFLSGISIEQRVSHSLPQPQTPHTFPSCQIFQIVNSFPKCTTESDCCLTLRLCNPSSVSYQPLPENFRRLYAQW